MLPLAKAAVLTVLLGGGTVGAYALTGGFSGSGSGNTETAQEETSEDNALPSQSAPADTPQIAPRGPEGTGDARPEEPKAGATNLGAQEQESVRDSESNESGPNPKESEGVRDATNQNTISGKNPGTNEVSSVSGKAPEGGDQNTPEKDTANSGGTAAAGGEEAEVTLGEEKTVSPSREGSDGHSSGA